MKKRLLALLLTLCMVVALLPTAVFAEGEEIVWTASEITISTAEELVAFEKYVNAGNRMENQTVNLGANIDLTGIKWKPIGNVTSYPGITFCGTFDGQDHVISNMTTSDTLPEFASAGLFGSLVGTIKNVTLENVNVTSRHYAGGICGYSSHKDGCTIENCKVIGGTVVSTPELLGDNYDNGDKVGGIIGYIVSGVKVTDCSVENVNISAYRDVGGIVGCATDSAVAGVTGCSVSNVTVTAGAEDSAMNYKNYNSAAEYNAGQLVGRHDNDVPESNKAEAVRISYAPAVAKIGDTEYLSLAEAIAEAQDGETVKIIKNGTYKIPALPKNITIAGAVEGVVFDCAGSGSIASIPNGASFENVTMNFGNSEYHGFQHAGEINMTSCTLNGLLISYGDMNFTECDFVQDTGEYMMWAYGNKLTYTDCTFTNNVKGKFINVYNEGGNHYEVTFEGCKFVNNGSESKAAVNVKETCGTVLLDRNVTINDCTYEGAFPAVTDSPVKAGDLLVLSPLVQVDDRLSETALAEGATTKIIVNLDGKQVYPHAHDLQKTEAKDATCVEAGNKEYYTCSDCEKIYLDEEAATETTAEDVIIPMLTTHTLTKVAAKEATCKEAGNKEYYTCSVCEKLFSDAEGKTDTTAAAVAIAKLTTHTWDSGKVTKAATCKETGVKTYTCTVCGETKTEDIAKLTTHTWNNGEVTKDATFEAPGVKTYTCKVCGETKTEEIPKRTCAEDETCPVADFEDVETTAWYHDGVHFCAETGLMKGTGDEKFEPETTTTRAMIATILYRLAGEPAVDMSKMTFKDVPANAWYAKAVCWAQANGVVKGYSATEYGPEDEITREQFATMLYRYADDFKGLDVSAAADLSKYTDAKNVSTWAAAAVAWANAEKIVRGTSATTLEPAADATRAQAATMIQRFCNNVQ